jgi:DNA polymerase-3 subunit alpha (Gram-positive type)
MKEQLYRTLLQNKTMTLSEYARSYLSVKYSPSMEPMIVATIAMDNRFVVKDGRLSLSKEAITSSFEVPFIILDVETTGLQHQTNYVVELAAVKMEDGRIVDELETLIKPPIEISDEVSRINGITNDMLTNSPTFNEIADKFISFMGDGVFVAHNAKFDWRFINAELKRNNRAELSNRCMCTIATTKVAFPGLPTYKLEYLTEYFKTTSQNTHRALDDVKATAEVLLKVLPKISKGQLRKLMNQ